MNPRGLLIVALGLVLASAQRDTFYLLVRQDATDPHCCDVWGRAELPRNTINPAGVSDRAPAQGWSILRLVALGHQSLLARHL